MKAKQRRAQVRRARNRQSSFVDEAHGMDEVETGMRAAAGEHMRKTKNYGRKTVVSWYDGKERRRIVRSHKRRGDSVPGKSR